MRLIIEDISRYSSWLPLLVVVIGGILTIAGKSVIKREMIPLMVLAVFHVIIEMSSSEIQRLLGGQNISILPYYLIIDFTLISIYFNRIGVIKYSQLRKWLFLGIVLIEAFVLVNAWMTISRLTESIGILFLSGLWFRSTYSMKERVITKLPEFWIVGGMMLFYIPSALIFAIDSSYLDVTNEFMSYLHSGKNTMNIINKTALTYGLWIYLRK